MLLQLLLLASSCPPLHEKSKPSKIEKLIFRYIGCNLEFEE